MHYFVNEPGGTYSSHLDDGQYKTLVSRYEDQKNAYLASGIAKLGDKFNIANTQPLVGSNVFSSGGVSPLRLIGYVLLGVIIIILIRRIRRIARR